MTTGGVSARRLSRQRKCQRGWHAMDYEFTTGALITEQEAFTGRDHGFARVGVR